MKVLNNFDLNNNQLLNARVQNLASDLAAAGNASVIFYNSTTSLAKISNGTTVDTLTNLLESVSGSGAISVAGIVGKSQVISIVAATGGVPGTMSAADFSKLAASASANTASAIVQRDASGNFLAGTITAALTGTASNAAQLNAQSAAFYLSRTNHTATQLAATISDFDAQVRTSRLDQMAAPTASVSMASHAVTNLLDPVNPQDAATKNYVDASATGLEVKTSVRAGSTANVVVTYSAAGGTVGRGQITVAPNVLDGVTLAANNRVLLKNQTVGAQNGIWVVTTLGTGANGVWDRSPDFDQDAEVNAGAFMFIEEGTQNGDSGWVLTTNNPIVIGGASGTALVFAQFSSAGSYTAGNGLTLGGGVFTVVGTANRIVVSGAGVDIAATYVGQTSITTVGTIASGTWAGTAIALASGGTGATTAATARTALGAITRYAQTLSTSATSYTVTHSLGTQDVDVVLRDTASQATCLVDSVATDVNTVTLTFAVAPAANAYRVSIFG